MVLLLLFSFKHWLDSHKIHAHSRAHLTFVSGALSLFIGCLKIDTRYHSTTERMYLRVKGNTAYT